MPLRGPPAAALQKTDRAGNPWGLPSSDRMAWAGGLMCRSQVHIKNLTYCTGLAVPRHDRRVRKWLAALYDCSRRLKVNFAVLGPRKCTGESARRMGDEFLFQQLAGQNVESLTTYSVTRIVAHCPHCVNLRNDYSQVGGNYEVLHHSQLLAEPFRQDD